MSHTFETLGLRAELVRAVAELGFESPTPIQIGAIPALLEGRDIIGQAQTGTGKTAAFALPMLQNMNPAVRGVQAIILTPTRELAMQVAEATQSYARHIGARVAAIYGGSSYNRQVRQLQQGAHIVVGTPGRTLDLVRQGILDLTNVYYLVLDEADEMLSMGFIDDVETIVAATSAETRQTALFSATMPEPIARLASRYMKTPETVNIVRKTMTVAETEQRFYLVYEEDKFKALSRLLEVEEVTGALVFARTKVGAAQLAEGLLSRGYPAEALHGDLNQEAREIVMRRFRSGQLSILVATDVVARGVDIQGVSHVFNFDMPYDAEDYVHRIGRTGRAGRTGIAITLVTPRERRWLRQVETFTRQRITQGKLPNFAEIKAKRDERFKLSLNELLETDLSSETNLIAEMVEAGYNPVDIAAATMHMARSHEFQRPMEDIREAFERNDRPARDNREQRRPFGGDRSRQQEPGMVRLTLNLGRAHGIQPGDVVGAIASEAGIPGRAIGAIDIRHQETLVDVKEQHVERVLRQMTRSTLRGQPVKLTVATGGNDFPPRRRTDEQERRKVRKPI
jgi:ATP-dependent RNA helicase DeaD